VRGRAAHIRRRPLGCERIVGYSEAIVRWQLAL
jgi:hypothetical protein